MAIVLALLSALAYGTADFTAGLASRQYSSEVITFAAQALGVLTAAVAVLISSGAGPTASALGWGALSGVGSAIGTLALYRGLAVARMSIVATVSAVLTTVIPAVVGVALGNQLATLTAVGIVIAVPAIGLVSWQPEARGPGQDRTGLLYGVLAGLGFALLFVALDQAGTRAGAWPLLPGQSVSLLLVVPFAYHGMRRVRRPPRTIAAQMLAIGVLSGSANLLFLAATSGGALAVVAVLTSLYPVATVLLARTILAERWTRVQATGLLTALVAVVLVSAG